MHETGASDLNALFNINRLGDMIVPAILFFLQLSIAVHIYFLINYILKKEKKYLKRFVNTAISNILLGGVLTVLALVKPVYVRHVNLKLMFWIMAGLLMLMMLSIKVRILRNMYRRSKDPANYHLNFFGKKVLHSSVVLQEEVYVFFFTIPLFLITGAYFFARFINYLLYGHL